MKYKLKVTPKIFEKYPEYNAMVIYAQDLENQPSDEHSTKLLREAENRQRQAFGTEKVTSQPHIVAWRNAYKSFGAKPSKYLCAVEALLSRTLKGQDLPTINHLVDFYNALSIHNILPIGGEDWDYLTSDLILKFATGKEPFVTYQSGKEVVDYPKPGEIIWVDSTGVTCRRWNWRQCHRTALTVDTCNAYFVLDRLPPYPMEELTKVGEELIQHLKQFSPNCTITQEILSTNNFG